MNNLAIIPARGGSKRIPGKNIREFLGKPIISYSIQIAKKSDLFSEVMVSTDDEKIAEIAEQYGAVVPFLRSKQNADDHATLSDVIDEVIVSYRNNGKRFDCGCCLLPTAPLMKPDKLKEAYELLIRNKYDSVKPVVPFSYPIQRALRLRQGKVEMINQEFYRTRSQDLETTYHDAAQFYWFNFNNGLKGDLKAAIVLNDLEVQDIDNEDDWKMAELKYQILKSKNQL
jgi:N-acylneuraminate cytidylyltransferase